MTTAGPRHTAELLAGPQGRLLCLDLASLLDREVAGLREHLDRATETQDRNRQDVAETLDPDRDIVGQRPVTVPALVAALGELNLETVTAAMIDLAMTSALEKVSLSFPSHTRGHQLAEIPEIVTALEPLARRVLDHPATLWWSNGVLARQWYLTDVGPNAQVLPIEYPSLTLSWWRDSIIRQEHNALESERNFPGERLSGDWWSAPERQLTTVGHLPHAIDLLSLNLCSLENTATELTASGRVYEVTNAEDWASLCRQFPIDVTLARRGDWDDYAGFHGSWLLPDWAAVSRHWDGVHVTALGYLSASYWAIPVDDERSTIMAGWNPDETLWLTDSVRETGRREFWIGTDELVKPKYLGQPVPQPALWSVHPSDQPEDGHRSIAPTAYPAIDESDPAAALNELLAETEVDAPTKTARTGRRWAIAGVTLVVVAGVVFGGAVLANNLVRGIAEEAVASKLTSSAAANFPNGADVTIGGQWPLFNYLGGTLESVSIDAPEAVFRDVPVALNLAATGVNTDLAKPVDSVDLTVALNQDGVNAFVPAPGPNAALQLGDGDVRYSVVQQGPFGLSIGATITAQPTVAGTTLTLAPTAAEITTPLGNLNAQPIIDAILQSKPVDVCLADKLPVGTELTGLTVTPSTMTLTATGKNLILDAALLRKTGTC